MSTSSWRPLAACLLCGFVAGCAAQGWRKDAAIAELQRAAATSAATAATALVQATGRVLTLERAAVTAVAERTEQLNQEQDNAKTERDRFNAGVRSGAVRVSIRTAGGQCTTAADPVYTVAAGGDRRQARAELDPATAAALDAIAGDGDDATRQLNACIDAYNTVRDTYHVQAQ